MPGKGQREDYDEVAAELERLSERIGDMSMALVRDAIEHGSGRPEDDKVLAQARRAVDKAADLLRRLTTR